MEIKDTRLRALHMLLAEVGNKKAELARRVKKSPVQISQWLSGYRRELSLAIAIDRRFRVR